MKQVTFWMNAAFLTLCCMGLLTACTKDGDVIYKTDPADQASTAPLVTVLYSANALGDGNYNDLIYQGVERAALAHGLRTMQLSPATHEEGLAYLETLLQQLSNQQDTVRRLLIVASAGYDDYLRQNNKRIESNPYCDLLYMETSTPLSGKGSTLYLPYYGAMYEAGAIAPVLWTNVLLVAANPKLESITEAVDGFTDGYHTDYIAVSKPDYITSTESDDVSKELAIEYLSDDVYGGFTVSDDLAVDIMKAHRVQSYFNLLVPICGGAATTFQRMCELDWLYQYMGIDAVSDGFRCPFSAVKHVDKAVARCIDQWLSAEGMPKHQTLGLAEGYTEVAIHPSPPEQQKAFNEKLTDELRATIHNEAIRKEELKMKNEE